MVVNVYKPTWVIGLIQNGYGETKRFLNLSDWTYVSVIQIALPKYPGQ